MATEEPMDDDSVALGARAMSIVAYLRDSGLCEDLLENVRGRVLNQLLWATEPLQADVDKQTIRAGAYAVMAHDANATLGGVQRNERLRDAARRVMAEDAVQEFCEGAD